MARTPFWNAAAPGADASFSRACMLKPMIAFLALSFAQGGGATSAFAQAQVPQFEARHTHAIALTPDRSRLLALNTPDARLSVFDVSEEAALPPVLLAEIPVALEAVSVRARTNDEAWVVNELSDCVSIVDLRRGVVIDTLPTPDEPADVVFAGGKAFVTCARSNAVRVFDAATRAPLGTIALEGIYPRALAATSDGTKVYAGFFFSGNRTTILPADKAPAPPAPTNPGLPPAPKTALIVPADHPQIAYEVLDRDVVEINVATLTVTRYFGGAGTNIHDLAVDPVNGDIWAANTEARNLVRFEPALRGRPVDNRLTRIAATDGSAAVYDLNPGVDYTLLPNPAARETALAQPTAAVFASDGEQLWITAFGSDRVARLARDGSIAQRVDLRGHVPDGGLGTRQMRGPRSLALDAGRARLYVYNKLSHSITVVGTASAAVICEFPLGSYDPMPVRLREGRKFLFDARLSGNGSASCASCHPDADLDGVAWDLGDPSGEMFYTTGTNIGNPTVRVRELHPMKGPMMTQTLRGLKGMAPFHWRGDKHTIQSFNPSYDKLLGGAQIAADDMDALAAYLETLRHHPNPNRTLDDQLAATVTGGDVVRGRALFTSAVGECFECHAMPLTTNNNIDTPREIGSPQPIKTPSLRTVYQRTYFNPTPGQTSRSGYGLNAIGTGFRLPTAHPYVLDSFATQADLKDVADFVLSIETGTAPAVGQALTVRGSTTADGARLGILEAQAAAGKADLVGRGVFGGRARSFRFDAQTQTYEPDAAGEPRLARAALLAALRPDDSLTFLGVAPGDGMRLGIDRDENGTADQDEPRPALELEKMPDSRLRFQWPSPSAGWRLESAPGLSGPWEPERPAPFTAGAWLRLERTRPVDETRLYRLRRTW